MISQTAGQRGGKRPLGSIFKELNSNEQNCADEFPDALGRYFHTCHEPFELWVGTSKAGHKLEVRRLPDGEDLEIHCCWCGGTVIAGSARLMREIVAELKESGAKVVDIARSVGDAG